MTAPEERILKFIGDWSESGGGERSNCQPFLTELCDLLDVPHPDPAKPENGLNAYVFERAVPLYHEGGRQTTGFIDLYKRGCFVLEAKQGVERELAVQGELPLVLPQAPRRRGVGVRGTIGWDGAMVRARNQAERYARGLPPEEGRPPFLLVVDVGHVIEVFSEFTCTGGMYVPFPDSLNFRIGIEQLADESIRERLRCIWLDPMSLDPSRRSARVTREIADHLAALARSLEEAGHGPNDVAAFLMRAIFTMFAEDIDLLPERRFTELLETLRDQPEAFAPMVQELWQAMKEGTFSTTLRADLRHFNGHLFERASALPLTRSQLDLLIEAAHADWRDVEPAIFGTLLERALDPAERHKLGAHFTPRAYVERLVLPTIIEPLRAEWQAVQAAAMTHVRLERVDQAKRELDAFHDRLCKVRVLDPACGSGNFLYVTLEHLKRLEGEVLDTLESLGEARAPLETMGITVDPHQFYGLEVNPRAVAVADLVLWIGYLQWHVRTRGDVSPPEPIIRKIRNMLGNDAVLTWDREEPVLDDDGRPSTRWDGRTNKRHPTTGEDVPDETARVPIVRYINPGKPHWPPADFVIGNPPYIGNWRMRTELSDGYAEAIRAAHADLPETCDYVMYWWDHAAQLVREGKLRRFGFITTNSVRQTFNRRVIEKHQRAKDPVSLLFAIPDHPWVDAADGADVRVAMTVAGAGETDGRLVTVEGESSSGELGRNVVLSERIGRIHPDLTIRPPVSDAARLKANDGISCRGVSLHGAGFIVTQDQAAALGLGRIDGLGRHIRSYRNGRDITQTPRGVRVIDLFDLTENEVRDRFPEVYQWVLERVKPEREAKAGRTKDSQEYASNWWLFGKARSTLRASLKGLDRYIATSETAKHRFFVFLDAEILPDNMLVNIASDDAYVLGVLSSRIHVSWALAQGGTLEDRPRYNKTRCFETFPFPEPDGEQRAKIRDVADKLDAHRKRQQELHPDLAMTDMYNVLERLRTEEALSEAERTIHEHGLVAVLRQIHDELDQAVAEAYGWPADLTTIGILERLINLNRERAEEEARGAIRWLRPAYQNPEGMVETAMVGGTRPIAKRRRRKIAWPKSLAAQTGAVTAVLSESPEPLDLAQLAAAFKGARKDRLQEILETLEALGQIRRVGDGRYLSD